VRQARSALSSALLGGRSNGHSAETPRPCTKRPPRRLGPPGPSPVTIGRGFSGARPGAPAPTAPPNAPPGAPPGSPPPPPRPAARPPPARRASRVLDGPHSVQEQRRPVHAAEPQRPPEDRLRGGLVTPRHPLKLRRERGQGAEALVQILEHEEQDAEPHPR